jgi:hypothetical protein
MWSIYFLTPVVAGTYIFDDLPPRLQGTPIRFLCRDGD